MGKMNIDGVNVDMSNEIINLAILGAYFSEEIVSVIESVVDNEIEYLTRYDSDGVIPDNFDFSGFGSVSVLEIARNNAGDLADLIFNIPELNGAITIESVPVNEWSLSRDLFSEPDYFPVRVSVDGEKLKAAYVEHFGTHEIEDGYGVSGFIRTAKNSYWSFTQMVRAFVKNYSDCLNCDIFELTSDEIYNSLRDDVLPFEYDYSSNKVVLKGGAI